jgi:hypothetical protein
MLFTHFPLVENRYLISAATCVQTKLIKGKCIYFLPAPLIALLRLSAAATGGGGSSLCRRLC